MFVWMSGLLDVSRAFYTEKQRECFFKKVDQLYEKYCIQSVREVFPGDVCGQIEKKIRQGNKVEDWWETFAGPEADMESFIYDRVYKALFDDLRANIEDYVEEICSTAPEERPEEWYKCSLVKSLLHEFINDRRDPYKIAVHLSERETAFLAYTICSILSGRIRRTLGMNDRDAGYMQKVLYCGEFAQNDWLNLAWHENVQTVRRKVTEQFLYTFLSKEYNPGMDPASFSEFIHDEIISPFYMAVYEAREEIMEKSREYWEDQAASEWMPDEMDRFCRYITEHVDLEMEEPHLEWYLQDESGKEDLTEDPDGWDE